MKNAIKEQKEGKGNEKKPRTDVSRAVNFLWGVQYIVHKLKRKRKGRELFSLVYEF